MVRKRDAAAPAPAAHVPDLPAAVAPRALGGACPPIDVAAYDFALAGSPHRFGDYAKGERIDHVDGVTVEEAEHMIATRLYQNTAKVHFNQFSEGQGRFGRRLIYGGHVISLARALSFNGLANAFHVAAINGGRHVAPLFAGDTVFAWSEILETAALPGRDDVGALRVRLVATKNRPCADFPFETARATTERHPRLRLLGPAPRRAEHAPAGGRDADRGRRARPGRRRDRRREGRGAAGGVAARGSAGGRPARTESRRLRRRRPRGASRGSRRDHLGAVRGGARRDPRRAIRRGPGLPRLPCPGRLLEDRAEFAAPSLGEAGLVVDAAMALAAASVAKARQRRNERRDE